MDNITTLIFISLCFLFVNIKHTSSCFDNKAPVLSLASAGEVTGAALVEESCDVVGMVLVLTSEIGHYSTSFPLSSFHSLFPLLPLPFLPLNLLNSSPI